MENSLFIATGNWGCGVSCKGEKKLKSILQIMACCVADKSMIYFTFKNLIFSNELQDFYKFLCENKFTVCMYSINFFKISTNAFYINK